LHRSGALAGGLTGAGQRLLTADGLHAPSVFTVTGDIASGGHLRVGSATLQISGDHTAGGEVLLNTGSSLSGADTLPFSGTLNWLGGMMTGTGTPQIGTGGRWTVAGSVVLQDARKLPNEGTLIQTDGSVSIQNGATLTNNATMDLRGDGAWANAGGPADH